MLLQGGEEVLRNMFSSEVQGWEKTVGGREEDSFILIAERAAPVTSTGNKHYSHTAGAAGANHGEAAKLQQQQQHNRRHSCKARRPAAVFSSSSSSTHSLFLLAGLFLPY